MVEISVYFHIPFCTRRCGYCDFNTYAGMTRFVPEYMDAICQEVKMVAERASEELIVKTIYLGGGTPSLVPLESLAKTLDSIREVMSIQSNAEISLEANPGTLTIDYLTALYNLGFNRISLGMQSANSQDLEVLDRQHQNEDVQNAVAWSRSAGFKNLNLDLIFGIPGQDLKSWRETINKALSLKADHYSLYSLTAEEGTPLYQAIESGKLTLPSEDEIAAMYEDAIDIMEGAGFQQYEISNWSNREETRCAHNLQYWRYLPWLGFGAGAHGYLGKVRTENIHEILPFIQSVKTGKTGDFPSGPALKELVKLSTWELIQENLMMSLRLTEEGLNLVDFKQRYKVGVQDLFPHQIDLLIKRDLLQLFDDDNRMRLTRNGRIIGNQVFRQFLNAKPPKGREDLLT